MTWSEVTVVTAGALLLLAWAIWVVASRLDRLHRKVAASRAVLDNQLVRRASVAGELAASGLLDPVSSVLVGEAAWEALAAGAGGEVDAVVADLRLVEVDRRDAPVGRGHGSSHLDRELAESELSRTVRAALAEPEEVTALRAEPLGAELLDTLSAAWYRVQLARRFHNEAVAQTQRVRRKVLVRLLRLHGHAPMPATVEIDDAWPDALGQPGAR